MLARQLLPELLRDDDGDAAISVPFPFQWLVVTQHGNAAGWIDPTECDLGRKTILPFPCHVESIDSLTL